MKTLVRRVEGRSAIQRADELGKRAEYLAFSLGGELFGIEIGDIVEILKPLPITEVPRSNPDIVGVMSVRGRLVTALNLRRRLRLPTPFIIDRKSRILLVMAADEEVGLVVDELFQVYRLSESEIEPPASLGTDSPSHVVGIARPVPIRSNSETETAKEEAPGPVILLLNLAPLLLG
jgi:purine-binding chemotaxis protein CheW